MSEGDVERLSGSRGCSVVGQDATHGSPTTGRELEVLRLIARGLTSAETTGEITVAVEPVETQLARTLAAPGLRDAFGPLCSPTNSASWPARSPAPGERLRDASDRRRSGATSRGRWDAQAHRIGLDSGRGHVLARIGAASTRYVTWTTPWVHLSVDDDAARSAMNDAMNASATPCEVGVHVLCCSECHCACHDDSE